MNTVTKTVLPNQADRMADYKLEEFDPPRYARVKYVPQESRPDRVVIEAQAFEVDANGNFISIKHGPKAGEPSRTSGTSHVIALSGISAGTHTLKPGWVKVPGSYDPSLPDGSVGGLPEGVPRVDSLPSQANTNDQVWYNNTLWRWDEGMIESVMRSKAEELAALLRNEEHFATFTL